MKWLIGTLCVAMLASVCLISTAQADTFLGISFGDAHLGVSVPTVAGSTRRYYRRQGRQAGRAGYRAYRAGGSVGLQAGASDGLSGSGSSVGYSGGSYAVGASSGFSGQAYVAGGSNGYSGGNYSIAPVYARSVPVRYYSRGNNWGSPCPGGNCP